MKIFIFGIVASGKTTLAKKLSASLNIPCYEGDSIAGGVPGDKIYKRTNEEQAETIKRIDQKGDWLKHAGSIKLKNSAGKYNAGQRSF